MGFSLMAGKFGAEQTSLNWVPYSSFQSLIGHHAVFPGNDSVLSHYISSFCISVIMMMTPPRQAASLSMKITHLNESEVPVAWQQSITRVCIC